MRIDSRLVRSFSVLTIAVFAIACSESSTSALAPDSDTKLVRTEANVTLDTPDGSYAIDLYARELSDGSGRIVQLTEGQAGMIASLYQEIAFADELGYALVASPPPIPMCGPNPCEPALRGTSGGGGVSGALESFGGRRRGGDGRTLTRRIGIVRSSKRVQSITVMQEMGARSSGNSGDFAGPWACLDIAEAIIDVRNQAADSRLSVGRVLSEVFASVQFSIAAGRLVGSAGSATWVTANIEAIALTHLSRSVALSMLAGLYSANNCWNRNWVDRGTYSGGGFNVPGAGGGGAGGYWIKDCHYETWQISYDGGVSWFDFVVSVCEYNYQAE